MTTLFYILKIMTPKRNNPPQKPNFWATYKIEFASTLFAITIWFLIVTGGTFDYSANIPIVLPRGYQDYVITSPLPPEARVRLRGQGRYLLTFLIFEQARLVLDFTWETGQVVLHPTVDNVLLYGNAKKLSVLEVEEPTTIRLTIEKVVLRKVPIVLNVKIKPMAGYTIVGDIHMEPDYITLKGPESQIDLLDSINTKEEIWTDLKRSVQRSIALVPPSQAHFQYVEQKVIVSVDIQKLMEKKLSKIPVKVVNLPPHLSATVIPPTISLVIEGGVNIVSRIESKDIKVYVDYNRRLDTSKYEYLAVIEEIPGVRPRDFEPKKFKLVLEHMQEK
jgi:hypothetical protein